MGTTFQRYTDEAKRAIYFAHAEAVHRDEQFISAKDLLVGLTWEGESRACRIGLLKEKAVELRAAAGIAHLPLTALPYFRKAAIPLNSEVKKVLAYAGEEADAEKQFWIDSDHLLRGLLRFSNEATSSLGRINVQLDSARLAAMSDRAALPPLRVPKGAKLAAFAQKNWFRGILILAFLLIFLYLKSQG